MSSSAAGGPPGEPGKDKKGFGKKLLSRAKTVFRSKGDSSKRASILGTSSTTAPLASTSAAAAPAAAPKAETTTKKKVEYENVTRVPKAQIQEERARKLGAKFGIEINPSEWQSIEGDVLRVDKSPRMRIHRECHKCQTTFGAGNECPGCKHIRCKKCTRHPPKRTEAEKEANRARREAQIRKNKELAPIIPSYDYSPQEKIVLTRPSKTGGTDLVYRPPRMRVRRHCHVCSNLISGSKTPRTCDNCGHKRCDDCPRQPEARNKYPFGYLNDEPGAKFVPTQACHECKKKFPRGAEDGTECAKCSHKKCSDCPRVKPRKIEPEPDPEIMERLQARFRELSTNDS